MGNAAALASTRERTWAHAVKGVPSQRTTAQWPKAQMLRDHGQAKKYYHDIEGYNGRLDSIQAGILAAKLTHLAQWNASRQAAARRYDELLSSAQEVIRPYCEDWGRGIFHLYVIRVEDREGLQRHLAAANIGTGIHYPVPLHLQNAYESLGHKQGDFPVTERIAAEILSLPMFPHITEDQQARVVNAIRGFLATRVAPEKVGARQD